MSEDASEGHPAGPRFARPCSYTLKSLLRFLPHMDIVASYGLELSVHGVLAAGMKTLD